jgi:hypothetical protein
MTRPPITLHPLEPRRLLASPVTYTLVELPFEPLDLNNADQILAADSVYQIHRAARLTKTILPTISTGATLAARKFNDEGIVIGTETLALPDNTTRSQEVLLGPNRLGVYEPSYLFDGTTAADDQTNAPVVINDIGQILTNGGEDESLPNLTGDVRLFTLGRHGALTNESANGLLQGGTRTIDVPIDINNAGQLITTDAAFPIDNFVTFRRGVGTLQTAEQLAGGAPAPLQKLNALNDNGQIVGATQQPGPNQHLNATLYQLSIRGRYYRTFLGTLPTQDTSQALAINNFGQILGTSGIIRSSGRIVDLTATITLPDPTTGVYGATQDLNTLIPDPGKDRVTQPIAINDAGVIIAEGISTRNSSRRFLLLLPSRANRRPTSTTAFTSPPPTSPNIPRATPFSTADLLHSETPLF